jgi:hypothetical protein
MTDPEKNNNLLLISSQLNDIDEIINSLFEIDYIIYDNQNDSYIDILNKIGTLAQTYTNVGIMFQTDNLSQFYLTNNVNKSDPLH